MSANSLSNLAAPEAPSSGADSTVPDFERVMAAISTLTTRMDSLENRAPLVSPRVERDRGRLASPGRTPHRPAASEASALGVLRSALAGASAASGVPPPRAGAGSDSDSDSDGEAAATPSEVAVSFRANIRRCYSSVSAWVRSVDWANARHGHEARRIATAIDALEKDGVDLKFEGVQVLLTNLAALHSASEFSESACMLEVMEWAPPEQAVPREFVRRAIKDAERLQKVKPRKKKGGDRHKHAASDSGAARK